MAQPRPEKKREPAELTTKVLSIAHQLEELNWDDFKRISVKRA